VAVVFILRIRRDLGGVIDAVATLFQGADMAIVAMLVEGDEEVRLIPGTKDFSAAEVDLENRRPPADGRRDGHVGHDVLLIPACQTG
jgi:hypothetical protein